MSKAYSTKNFSLETDPKLACTCGHKDCDERVLFPSVMRRLQKIRDDLGEPIIITSGGRCPNHPSEAHKTMPGDHQQCFAVDVLCNKETTETKLKVLAGRHGATRVAGGKYCGFMHIAWTPTHRRDVPTWSYK